MSNGCITLHDYQKLMLRLAALSPYNAVHAVSLRETTKADLKLFQQAIQKTISSLGLGNPMFSPDWHSVSFTPMKQTLPLESRVIPLHEHVEHEMNHVYASDEFPLRFFIISHHTEHYFSITYNHWIADAYAISRLMESIFAHVQEEKGVELTLTAPKMEHCFQQVHGTHAFYYRCLTVIQTAIRFSRAFRTPIQHVKQTECSNCSYVFEPQVLQQLLQRCKAESITLNDLFLTALARIFGETTREKREKIKRKWLKPRRDRLIVAVISNIRKNSQLPLAHIFSLYLGFFYLSFKSPEKYSFGTLSQMIRAQTKRLKQKDMAVKQSLLFKVQQLIWDRKRTIAGQYRLFSKNTPITVGISNMDLSCDEGSLLNSAACQYIRYSPTAMVCPIVFNMTTFNHHLTLGINFRKACYTLMEVETLKARFIEELNQFIC